MAKTVKIVGTFEVYDASKCLEAKRKLNEETTHGCASQQFPIKIDPGLTNFQIPLGGVVKAKRLFLRTSQEVTLKIHLETETGFPFGPGDMIIPSTTGIDGLWVNTPASGITEFEVIALGEAS
jgi:hypothetical protein